LFGKEKEKKKKLGFFLIYITYGSSKIWGPFQFGGLKPLLKWLIGWAGHVSTTVLKKEAWII
jgi:hypothetical protein